MSEVTKIELTPEAVRLLSNLEAVPVELPQAVAKAMRFENALTLNHIKEAYLSFPRGEAPTPIGLRKLSGRLLQSAWASEPVIEGPQVQSAIGDNVTSRGVNYAEVHEFGGTAHHPARAGKVKLLTTKGGTLIGQAKNAKLAVFASGKAKHFKEVAYQGKAYDVEIPARGMFQRGINDRLENYGKSISAAVVSALGGKGS